MPELAGLDRPEIAAWEQVEAVCEATDDVQVLKQVVATLKLEMSELATALKKHVQNV
ncbi:hypothetical protein ACYZT3_04790 [Pseudomonas sp. MDT1-16]